MPRMKFVMIDNYSCSIVCSTNAAEKEMMMAMMIMMIRMRIVMTTIIAAPSASPMVLNVTLEM